MPAATEQVPAYCWQDSPAPVLSTQCGPVFASEAVLSSIHWTLILGAPCLCGWQMFDSRQLSLETLGTEALTEVLAPPAGGLSAKLPPGRPCAAGSLRFGTDAGMLGSGALGAQGNYCQPAAPGWC